MDDEDNSQVRKKRKTDKALSCDDKVRQKIERGDIGENELRVLLQLKPQNGFFKWRIATYEMSQATNLLRQTKDNILQSYTTKLVIPFWEDKKWRFSVFYPEHSLQIYFDHDKSSQTLKNELDLKIKLMLMKIAGCTNIISIRGEIDTDSEKERPTSADLVGAMLMSEVKAEIIGGFTKKSEGDTAIFSEFLFGEPRSSMSTLITSLEKNVWTAHPIQVWRKMEVVSFSLSTSSSRRKT